MGEYGFRLKDKADIKLGTCESMYYLRFEDIDKVKGHSGSVDPAREPEGLFYRIPFFDEDDVLPGDYKEYNRELGLYRKDSLGNYSKMEATPDMKPGRLLQLKHEKSGLMVNVNCYHGSRLPDDSSDAKWFWNGKNTGLVLKHLKCMRRDSIKPVIACSSCSNMWRCDWVDVWDYLDERYQERFSDYYIMELKETRDELLKAELAVN